MTTASVCIFSLILADYDSPFNGFIQIDLSHFYSIVKTTQMEAMTTATVVQMKDTENVLQLQLDLK